jgi:betaine-aldehyde dehydrogenase
LFGPLLVVERFRDEEDAIEPANATRYSLASSVWTRDATLARRMAARLKFGTVWSNSHNGMNDFMQTKHFYFETL